MVTKVSGYIASVAGISMAIIGLLSIIGFWHTAMYSLAFIILGAFLIAGIHVIKIQDDTRASRSLE